MQSPEAVRGQNELILALENAAYTVVTDRSGRILEGNERLKRTFGYAGEELVGRPFRRFLAVRGAAAPVRSLYRQLSQHQRWCGELCFRGRGGRPIWVEAHVVQVSAVPVRYRTIAFDITERKAVETALNASQQFSRTLMESAPVGIFIADKEGRCSYVNRRWSETSGLRLRGAILPGWEAAVSPAEQEKVKEAWRKFVAGEGTTFQQEFQYLRPDGSETCVLASAIRLEGEAGPGAQFLRVEQDLTELRRSQRLLDEQRIKLVSAAKLTALGEMAGGVAHEVNNPLAIIHGNAELLKIWADSGSISHGQLMEVAETIKNTSNRIAKIVRALRTISRNAEHDPPEPAPVSCLLEQVVSLSSARARDERILLKLDPVPAGLTVACRPAQVSQILLNLLNNAFYACTKGERWVHLEAEEKESAVEISVSDGGPPLDDGVREKLFQPFFTTKPVGVGTGLGLSIAAALAEGHGGSLTLDPESARTRFVLSLPKAEAKELPFEYDRAQ